MVWRISKQQHLAIKWILVACIIILDGIMLADLLTIYFFSKGLHLQEEEAFYRLDQALYDFISRSFLVSLDFEEE